MVITRIDADILINLIEVATEENWQPIAAAMIDRGHTGKEVEKAVSKLADIVGRTSPITANDF